MSGIVRLPSSAYRLSHTPVNSPTLPSGDLPSRTGPIGPNETISWWQWVGLLTVCAGHFRRNYAANMPPAYLLMRYCRPAVSHNGSRPLNSERG